jgi:hypothetical protein
MNKRNLFIILLIILVISIASLSTAQNEYESRLIGVWESEEEPDLIVFEENNIAYIMDIDYIRLTENGRWKATATQISVELQYNGKKYRVIYEYELINDNEVEVKIVKSLVDGKEPDDEEYLKKGQKFKMFRWEE